MKRTATIRILTATLGVAGVFAAYTQNPAPRPLRTQKVKDNLYMISGDGGNVAVLVTNEGVALVDDMYDRNYADIMAQVKGITDQPVKYVFNTHQHDDHAGSNAKMMTSAEVISHRNVRANMVKLKQPGSRAWSSRARCRSFSADRRFARNTSVAGTPTVTRSSVFRL